MCDQHPKEHTDVRDAREAGSHADNTNLFQFPGGLSGSQGPPRSSLSERPGLGPLAVENMALNALLSVLTVHQQLGTFFFFFVLDEDFSCGCGGLLTDGKSLTPLASRVAWGFCH